MIIPLLVVKVHVFKIIVRLIIETEPKESFISRANIYKTFLIVIALLISMIATATSFPHPFTLGTKLFLGP
jgi:hypothetical protein